MNENEREFEFDVQASEKQGAVELRIFGPGNIEVGFTMHSVVPRVNETIRFNGHTWSVAVVVHRWDLPGERVDLHVAAQAWSASE